jgi:hypothetical protein
MAYPVSRVDRHEPLNFFLVILTLTAVAVWVLMAG